MQTSCTTCCHIVVCDVVFFSFIIRTTQLLVLFVHFCFDDVALAFFFLAHFLNSTLTHTIRPHLHSFFLHNTHTPTPGWFCHCRPVVDTPTPSYDADKLHFFFASWLDSHPPSIPEPHHTSHHTTTSPPQPRSTFTSHSTPHTQPHPRHARHKQRRRQAARLHSFLLFFRFASDE